MEIVWLTIQVLCFWIVLPFLFFAIIAVVMGQILKRLGFKPAENLSGDDDVWGDDIHTNPVYSYIPGNIYYSIDDD